MNYYIFVEILFIISTVFFCIKKSNIITNLIPIIDYPNERKFHKKPTPLIGGIIALVLFFEIFLFENDLNIENIDFQILIISSVVFFVGLGDDLKDFNPYFKLLSIGIFLIIFFYLFPYFKIEELYFETLNKTLILNEISLFFSLLCILLLLNALNMSDGVSGLFLGIIIIFFTYIALSYDQNKIFSLLIIFSLIILFLLNFKNYFFMGDSGVYFLSIFFSFSLINSYHSVESNIKSIEEIFILLMIPGIDMFRVFLERLKKRKNPFKPDRTHLHHLLLSFFSEKLVLFIYFNMILLPLVIKQFKILNMSSIILVSSVLYLIVIYKLKSKSNKKADS